MRGARCPLLALVDGASDSCAERGRGGLARSELPQRVPHEGEIALNGRKISSKQRGEHVVH